MYYQSQILYEEKTWNSCLSMENRCSNRSRNGRSRIPVTIGSPLVNFFPGVRGDETRVVDDDVN